MANSPRVVTAQEYEVKRTTQMIRDFKRDWAYRAHVLYTEALDKLEFDRDQAVVAAHLRGVSKSAICRAMGTTNRHAVYDILESEKVFHPEIKDRKSTRLNSSHWE